MQPAESVPPVQAPPVRSPKQIEASRLNGRRSHGPVTQHGKDQSRVNALTHGLFRRVIPSPRYPIFYTQEEVHTLAWDIAARFGGADSYAESLAESVAMDMLRLRHIRALEHAMLEPDLAHRQELEQLVGFKRGDCCGRSERDIRLLHRAAGRACQAVEDGMPIVLDTDECQILADELCLWLGRPANQLSALRKELEELDHEENKEWAATRRAELEHEIPLAEAAIEAEGPAHLGLESDDGVGAVLAGQPLPTGFERAWRELIDRVRRRQTKLVEQLDLDERRIEQLRGQALRQSAGQFPNLKLLAEYEARVQRQMERTLTLLKDLRGTVIDL